MTKLTGECNQCGLCCVIGNYRCLHLITTGKLGTAQATACAVYKQRYDRMPIVLVDSYGRIFDQFTTCRKGPAETPIILPHIGKGCSLKVEEDNDGSVC